MGCKAKRERPNQIWRCRRSSRTLHRWSEQIVEGFGPEILDWQPNAERWSATMVIAHLAESEVNCFRLRLRRTAMELEPALEPYDQWAQFRGQVTASARAALNKWTREREETLKFLRGLPFGVADHQCTHKELGRLTFWELLNEFAFHDMGHIPQIRVAGKLVKGAKKAVTDGP